MDSFLTWEYVSTFMGTVFCVTMVTEYVKELAVIKDMQTKYVTSLVAFLLILFSSIFLGNFAFKDIPLILLNSILVTFTATGTRDFSYKKVTISERKE